MTTTLRGFATSPSSLMVSLSLDVQIDVSQIDKAQFFPDGSALVTFIGFPPLEPLQVALPRSEATILRMRLDMTPGCDPVYQHETNL
jgi:hypothetical protein